MKKSEAGLFIDNFFIRSAFLLSPRSATSGSGTRGQNSLNPALPNAVIAIGAHAIEVENLTTLPYDVEITSRTPEAADGVLFSFDDGTRSEWKASFKSLLNYRSGRSCIVIDQSNVGRSARILTSALRFRQPIWIEWEEQAIRPILEVVADW